MKDSNLLLPPLPPLLARPLGHSPGFVNRCAAMQWRHHSICQVPVQFNALRLRLGG